MIWSKLRIDFGTLSHRILFYVRFWEKLYSQYFPCISLIAAKLLLIQTAISTALLLTSTKYALRVSFITFFSRRTSIALVMLESPETQKCELLLLSKSLSWFRNGGPSITLQHTQTKYLEKSIAYPSFLNEIWTKKLTNNLSERPIERHFIAPAWKFLIIATNLAYSFLLCLKKKDDLLCKAWGYF